MAFLPYVFTVLSFFFGGAVTYLKKANQLDNLTAEVANLNQNITELTKKLDASNDRYNSLDKRTSKIEFYLFENKKPY